MLQVSISIKLDPCLAARHTWILLAPVIFHISCILSLSTLFYFLRCALADEMGTLRQNRFDMFYHVLKCANITLGLYMF